MITQIVRLRQVVKRWKTKRFKHRAVLSYSSSSEPDEPADSNNRTPSGSVAVYVGQEHRRFVIPTRFLNLSVFVALLNQAEEEFGFQTSGGLTLPCKTGFFIEILRFLEEDEEKFRGRGLEDFSKIVSEMGFDSLGQLSCKAPFSPASCHGFTALLHESRV